MMLEVIPLIAVTSSHAEQLFFSLLQFPIFKPAFRNLRIL